jgi:hypothetical protein
MYYELPHIKNNASIETVLNTFFVAFESIHRCEESIIIDNTKNENSLICFLLSLLKWGNQLTLENENEEAFNADELTSMSDALKRITDEEWSKHIVYLHYLTDEIVCNIQQHSCAKHSCGYIKYNNS